MRKMGNKLPIMLDNRIGLSSIKRPSPNEKLPIMHVIGNYLEQCHGQKSVLIPTLSMSSPGVVMSPSRSSVVLKGSQMFTCAGVLPVRPHDCSEAGREKRENSKLRGVDKTKSKNPVFPPKSDFESDGSKASPGPLPFHHPGCGYRCGWFPGIHDLALFGRSAGSGFFVGVPWQMYAVRSGGRWTY